MQAVQDGEVLELQAAEGEGWTAAFVHMEVSLHRSAYAAARASHVYAALCLTVYRPS